MGTRIDAAEAALDAYEVALRPMEHQNREKYQGEYQGEEPDVRLVDLLADLMHYARESEIDFERCVRIAEIHADAEPEEPKDYRNIGQFFERQGQYSVAAKWFEKADDLERT